MLSSPFATQQQQQQWQQPQPQGSPMSPHLQAPQLTTPREQQQSQQQISTPSLPWAIQQSPARQQTPAKPHSPPTNLQHSSLHAADLDTPLGPKAPQRKRLDAAFSAGMPHGHWPACQLLLELRCSLMCPPTSSSVPCLASHGHCTGARIGLGVELCSTTDKAHGLLGAVEAVINLDHAAWSRLIQHGTAPGHAISL